ncbi:MAG: ThiF family adenylyltransferase [Caulobacter sp.]|nr:ThiF family adenylyltransferase [Caulobacter sp.]
MTNKTKRAARSELHVTLKARGFHQVSLEAGAPVYEGIIQAGAYKVSVQLIIHDVLFTKAPSIRLVEGRGEPEIFAHVLSGRELCYSEASVEEYDLYNPGGAILRCIQSAQDTLLRVLHNNPIQDLKREFISYWKGASYINIDVPPDFVGPAVVVELKPESCGGLLVTTKQGVGVWGSRTRDNDAGTAIVIRTKSALLIDKNNLPGQTLESFSLWAEKFLDASQAAQLVDAAAAGSMAVVFAPNGIIATSFEWPKTVAVAFRRAPRSRRTAWVRSRKKSVTVARMDVQDADIDAITNARLLEPSGLTGRSVAIIGCGAIGSRVAFELVRSGAGRPGAPLVLIDPDVLRAENLGRHILGVDYINRPKADAMAEELRRFHPAVEVLPIPASALDCLGKLQACDFIVDATGHNPLALRLNDLAILRRRQSRFPPIVHSAIHGNGLAVQTILVDGESHACLKCMRPNHGEYRANPLKAGTKTEIVSAACGDGAYVPYAASAPSLAAALTVLACLEWAHRPEQPGPRVRTRVIDETATVNIKDRNWGIDPDCPACGQPHDME